MEIKHFACVVDGILGAFAPKVFAKRFPAWMDDEEQAILRAGPDSLEYWEVWNNVSFREHEEQSLYLGESGDVFILSDSPMQALVVAWESGHNLPEHQHRLARTVQKIAYEFLVENYSYISEDEALQHFSPSKYNDDLVNKALEWMHNELKEVYNG